MKNSSFILNLSIILIIIFTLIVILIGFSLHNSGKDFVIKEKNCFEKIAESKCSSLGLSFEEIIQYDSLSKISGFYCYDSSELKIKAFPFTLSDSRLCR